LNKAHPNYTPGVYKTYPRPIHDAMPVTRTVIDAMIGTGCPEAQAAGLAECLQISTITHVNTFPAAFPEMNFIYAMTVRREFRASFIR